MESRGHDNPPLENQKLDATQEHNVFLFHSHILNLDDWFWSHI